MKDYTKVCAVCGDPIKKCKVDGLHGMIRDRAATVKK